MLQAPLPNANISEAPDLVADSDLLGEDMPSPSEYLSTKQRDGKPLGADEPVISKTG